MERRVETDFAKFGIEDGILHFTYKKDVRLDIDAVRAVVRDRLDFQGGVDYPVLLDMRTPLETTKEAREYLALEGSKGLSRVAIVVGSLPALMESSLYVTLQRPSVPTRSFSDRALALAYLRKGEG